MPPRVEDYRDRRRDPAWERQLVRALRQETEAFRLQFIGDLLDARVPLALVFAQKCLAERRSFEALLHRGLREADASSIRFWLECVVPRLGFRRAVRLLNESGPDERAGVEKARYWLPLFEGLPGYAADALQVVPA